MKAHVVHGILTPVGTSALYGLIPYLKRTGIEVRVPDYGLITAVESKIANPIIKGSLLPYIDKGDIYIGHSNGCAIGYDLVKSGAPLAGLVLIDAALERDIELPSGMWADVYFNEGDDATLAAIVGADIGITASDWGDMGHAGYSGNDPAITNVNCGNTAGLPVVSGHGDIFSPGKLAAWAPVIVKRILTHGVMA